MEGQIGSPDILQFGKLTFFYFRFNPKYFSLEDAYDSGRTRAFLKNIFCISQSRIKKKRKRIETCMKQQLRFVDLPTGSVITHICSVLIILYILSMAGLDCTRYSTRLLGLGGSDPS